ncbi:uncharacterized protein LOC110721270 [Chenopodium quinoa]|uniref:uncharacterized protein LOC110721270 n=1 Tax=Chenopodium quinoa TaxID=63459 RepID=UPI000B7871A7|nr:uncharacterized protein LOC110721270 [Chenopodium quinoa]
MEILKVDVSPKVRHFFWRLCTNTLSVRSLINHRHMIEDATCPWCHNSEETPSHALVECIRVQELWEACQCIALTKWNDFNSLCDLIVSWKDLDAKMVQRGMILAWCFWGERNLKVFENRCTPNNILIDRINGHVAEQGTYASHIYAAIGLKPP